VEADKSGEVEGHIPSAPQSHLRGLVTFTFTSESATEEALPANKAKVEWFASISLMLSKLTITNCRISVASDDQSFPQYSPGPEHDGGSGISLPPFSERSHQSKIAHVMHDIYCTAADSFQPNMSKTASDAA
jgi:hypothetical protein